MAKIFITLTGTKHYFGNDFLEKGMKVSERLVMWQIVLIQSSESL